MVDVIPLRFGPIFKRAFSKPHIFREFVHAVTGVEVNVDRIHTEYEYPERIGNVNVMYDIFADVKPWLELIADSLDRQVDENDYELPTLKELITEIQRTTISSEESTAIKDETAWRMAVARHRREAQEDQQIESAKVMLDMDIELPAISKVTGLTIEEIQALDES